MSRYGTRSFAAWRALYDLLAAQGWPSEEGGSQPLVRFAGETDLAEHAPPPRETVDVIARIEDTQADWATLGQPGQNETVPLAVIVMSAIPGRSGIQVCDRLAELVAVVEAALRDMTTGQPVPLDVDCVAQLGPIVAQVAPEISPGPEGCWGMAEVRIVASFRI